MTTQLLHLTDARWSALVNGEKTDTIRLNEGRVELGFLVYESYPSLKFHEVVFVDHVSLGVPLSDVLTLTNDPLRRPDAETLLKRMKVHYPEIEIETKIDYIRHLTPAQTRAKYPDQVEAILSAFSNSEAE